MARRSGLAPSRRAWPNQGFDRAGRSIAGHRRRRWPPGWLAGNNNPYNQDNETSWLDWRRFHECADVHRFFQKMIAFRKAHPGICRNRFWREDVRWYGLGAHVDFSAESRCLAYALDNRNCGGRDLYVMINAHWESQTFLIQEGRPGEWKRIIDTALDSPFDIVDAGSETVVADDRYRVRARSIVVLTR